MQQIPKSETRHAYARTLWQTLAALFVQCMLCFLQTPTARCVCNTPSSPKLQHTPKSYAPIYVTLNTVSYRPCTLNYTLYTLYYVLYTMQIAKSYTAYGIQGLFHSLLACCISSRHPQRGAYATRSYTPHAYPWTLSCALVCDCACACARACACP